MPRVPANHPLADVEDWRGLAKVGEYDHVGPLASAGPPLDPEVSFESNDPPKRKVVVFPDAGTVTRLGQVEVWRDVTGYGWDPSSQRKVPVRATPEHVVVEVGPGQRWILNPFRARMLAVLLNLAADEVERGAGEEERPGC